MPALASLVEAAMELVSAPLVEEETLQVAAGEEMMPAEQQASPATAEEKLA